MYNPNSFYPPNQGYPPPNNQGFPPPNQGYPPPNNYGSNFPPPNYGAPQMNAPAPMYGSNNFGAPYGQASSVAYGSINSQLPSPTASFNGAWYANYYHMLNQMELQELRGWFSQVDRDRSGTITARELKDVTFGGRPLGYDTSVKLIKIFDRDRNKAIDFVEYATLHKFISTMQQIFTQCDFNRSGTLDSAEILTALSMGGFQLSLQGAKAAFHKHNKTNTGVAFIDFIDIAADVAILRTHFERRDMAKRGLISLTFDDLLAIAGDV